MKINNIKVYNFDGAMRGMRNPKDSWELSDSYFGHIFESDPYQLEKLEKKCQGNDGGIYSFNEDDENHIFEYASIGPKDMKLAKALIKGGSEHRKFLRQIIISMDLEAPLYQWKEIDTYKVGTVADSCSTMHKIHSYPIELDKFEIGDYCPELRLIDPNGTVGTYAEMHIDFLEQLRQRYLQEKEAGNEELAKAYWKELIRWLPESWLQKRTITMNYEVARSIVHQRKNHKLGPEWNYIIDTFRTLPYAKQFIFDED